MRRNGHTIKCKRAVKFESKRAEWCTNANFEEMYNEVYKEMVKGGIATELATEVFLDKQGEIVETAEESFGLPTKFMIQRPDKQASFCRRSWIQHKHNKGWKHRG